MTGTGRQTSRVAGRLSGAARAKKRLGSVTKLRVVAELPSTSRKRRVDIEEPEPELRALDEDQLAKVVSSVVERTVASLVQGGGKRRRLSEPEERIAMQAAIAAATATAAVLNPLIGRGQNGSSGPETSRLSSKGPKLRNPGRAEQLQNATRATAHAEVTPTTNGGTVHARATGTKRSRDMAGSGRFASAHERPLCMWAGRRVLERERTQAAAEPMARGVGRAYWYPTFGLHGHAGRGGMPLRLCGASASARALARAACGAARTSSPSRSCNTGPASITTSPTSAASAI